MKRVSLVTRLAFWRETGAGCISRMAELIKYLSTNTDLSIAFFGPVREDDAARLASLQWPVRLVPIEDYNEDREKSKVLFREFVEQYRIQTCIFENLDYSFLLDADLPALKKVLDAHDLKYENEKSYDEYSAPHGNWLSREEEYGIFNKYDAVLLITEADYLKAKAMIHEKAIFAPHPVTRNKPLLPTRAETLNIGFIGYLNMPNFDAITWFIKHVWPHFESRGLVLNIFGEIKDLLIAKENFREQLEAAESQLPGFHKFFWERAADLELTDRIRLHGYVPDLEEVYRQMDIAINPVRFGSGLKIKNVEALAYGLPLITTSHGAIGLEKYPDDSFYVADTPADFVRKLDVLVQGYGKRAAMSKAAYDFSHCENAPENCFKDLMAVIGS